MPAVTVTVPGLLARFTDGRQTVPVEAGTIDAALDRLVDIHPALAPHLFDGEGNLRTHLRLYRNGRGVEWEASGTARLDAGDEVLLLQAVSGG